MPVIRQFGIPLVGLAAAQSAPLLAWTPPGRAMFPATTRVPGQAAALTFDDGPDRSLDFFLSALAARGASATFFVMGEQVADDPGRLREIVSAGHEIGIHAHRHRSQLRLTPWTIADDLRRAKTIIEDASGRAVTRFRPPYGTASAGAWIEARRQGWEMVLWSRWGRDWEARATPTSIADLIGEARPGEILLLHDSDRYSAPNSWRRTLAALPLIIDRWTDAGVPLRSLSHAESIV
jgi:peptidoglycan/xylan/chitin deacetylase (PgdA/CDA1 family)